MEGRRRGIFRQALIVAAILLMTAALMFMILDQYKSELQRSTIDSNLNDAKVAMAELQSQMVEAKVIQEAFDSFRERAGRSLGNASLTPENTAPLSAQFLRSFPDRSVIVWFSRDFDIIIPQGFPELEQKRAWQAFVRSVVEGENAGVLDRKIADGFVKSNISDFLAADYFASLKNECQLIIFKSERNYLGLLRFGTENSARVAGYMLVLVPTSHARQFWLEERALRLARNRGDIAGAYVLSRDNMIEHSGIGENQLHGFASDHARGISYQMRDGVFYYSDRHFANPDMLLVIGLRLKSEDRLLEMILSVSGVLVWLPGLVCLLLPFSRFPVETFNWSLKTRFNLTTVVIVILPLLIGGVTSAINTARISLEMQKDEFNQLEKRLYEVEESVAFQTSNLELYLKTETVAKVVESELSQKAAREIYEDLKDRGCEVVIVILPDGRSWVASDLPADSIRQRNCYLVSLTRSNLKDQGFAMDVIDKTFPSPVRGSQTDDLARSAFVHTDFHNRIRRFDLGGNSFSSFVSYVSDRSGSIKACLNIGFNNRAMQNSFLRQVKKDSPGSLSRLYISAGSSKEITRLPASSRLQSILSASQITGDSFHFVHAWNNRQYLVYTRPFKELAAVGMAVKQIAFSGLNPRLEQLLTLLVTTISALLIALMIVNFFSGYFLRPLLKLSAMAARVETGDYSGAAFSGALNDEISVLSNNFGQMIDGLREKAAMRDYLRADLFEQAAAEQKIVAERADVTVLFAGIRDFSALEDQLSPEESMGLMSRFLEICETSVKENGGDIDKYIGDTAMAAFKQGVGAVAERQALLAALKIQQRVAQLRLELPAFAGLHTGVGLASGSVIAGHIGSLHNRLDYTFIGDTVNLAARLEKMAGRDGTPGILTTQELYQSAGTVFSCAKLAPVMVKGKARPVEVVAITGYVGEVPA
ncbi:MAG: hypothetical protein CVV42_03670 [Candidatus Riflebacteria bacterium HGW-Riflebacteria-2]|jgi:class 3 adenylate cyclase/tetrahydromethanopterin S-methyltransferase subunit G|nr:MAG: hypothetical protein CVV42_03670 [Candidatus Riflebacteria bacterium HGW-Riflebacteria-2]